MDYLILYIQKIPIQGLYAFVAAIGGVARYLNSYKNGQVHFSVSIFIASAFVSGFSGLMFALLGTSMALPSPLPYIMAGVGGFFGDQTMKFIMEYLSKKPLGEGSNSNV
jgi:hypothetical protein